MQKMIVSTTGRTLRGEERLPRHRRHDAPELKAARAMIEYLQRQPNCLYPTPHIPGMGELCDVIALALGTATEADIPPPPAPLTAEEQAAHDRFIDD